jgi:hypothetical protein
VPPPLLLLVLEVLPDAGPPTTTLALALPLPLLVLVGGAADRGGLPVVQKK